MVEPAVAAVAQLTCHTSGPGSRNYTQLLTRLHKQFLSLGLAKGIPYVGSCKLWSIRDVTSLPFPSFGRRGSK